MDEYPISLDLERKYVDSVYHKRDEPSKVLKINNYNISNVEFCKNLVSQIEEKVLYNSESSTIVKAPNYEPDLADFIARKDLANKIISTDTRRAIVLYEKLSDDIGLLCRDMASSELETKTVKDILSQRKLVMSNLSAAFRKLNDYKRSIDLDLEIIQYDPRFDKSYGRLIDSYIRIDNLNMANYYANELNNKFPYDVVMKYTEFLKSLEDANNRNDQVQNQIKFRN